MSRWARLRHPVCTLVQTRTARPGGPAVRSPAPPTEGDQAEGFQPLPIRVTEMVATEDDSLAAFTVGAELMMPS